MQPMWWTPEESTDFRLLEGSIFTSLGLLETAVIRPLIQLVDDLSAKVAARPTRPDTHLAWLVAAMSQARSRLLHFPCSFRDAVLQVRETQRYWLMIDAYVQYYDVYTMPHLGAPRQVHRHLMGAFTTEPRVVQTFFNAGIPVWFIRSDVSLLQTTAVRAVVLLQEPVNICTARGPDDNHVLYSGLAGDHLRFTARGGHTYLDVSRAPLLAVDMDGGYAAPVAQKEYRGLRAHATSSSDISSTPLQSHSSSSRSMGTRSQHHHPCT